MHLRVGGDLARLRRYLGPRTGPQDAVDDHLVLGGKAAPHHLQPVHHRSERDHFGANRAIIGHRHDDLAGLVGDHRRLGHQQRLVRRRAGHADLAEAARLYRLAAEKGSVAGQYDLAYLYEQGSGVERNETEAAKWYESAASGGDPLAQYDIGQRYLLGVGVSTNRTQAFKWLTLAAGQGQADSTRLLPEVKGQLSAAELTQANQLVKEFVPRAAAVAP